MAFHELREWSREVERGGGGGGGGGAGRGGSGVQRLRFFVRKSIGGGDGALSAVSAPLPSPAAARRSRDPLVLLRPLLVAAGLAEKGAATGEECYLEDDEEEERRQQQRWQRSGAQTPSSSSASAHEEDVDDTLLASLRDPAAFFSAALRASRARRARAAARAASPVVLDASRRRAALKIVHSVSVKYGEGFSSSSSSPFSAALSAPSLAPEEVSRQVRRLAETVEDFLGRFEEEEDENRPLLRGSTILLVKKKKKTNGKKLRRSSSSSGGGVDLLTGSISLDVSDSTQTWLETLEEASDPARGAAALRRAAERRAEAEALAASALGVDSVALRPLAPEEELDEGALSRYDALVRELASAAAPASSSTHERRRHAGLSVAVVVASGAAGATAAAAPSSSPLPLVPAGTIAVGLDEDSPSAALSVFSAVERAAPAATAGLLERRRAEEATRGLLRAAGTKLGVSSGELKLGEEDDGKSRAEGEKGLQLAEAAAAAARILRAPDISRIAGSARGLREVYLGRRNAVSWDGEKVTLGVVDFEV